MELRETIEQLLTPSERASKLTDTIHMMQVSSESQLQNLQAILKERKYQDDLWGPASDRDSMTELVWLKCIHEYANAIGRASNYSFRTRMIKTAALALAALEAEDGKVARGAINDKEKVGG